MARAGDAGKSAPSGIMVMPPATRAGARIHLAPFGRSGKLPATVRPTAS